MKTVEIEILGKIYYLKSNDPDNLQDKAKFLNKNLDELNEKYNTVDQNKLFVLYLLILLEKYLDVQDRNEKLSAELKQVEDLLKNISED